MRKEKIYTIEKGEDAGKTFLLKRMPMMQADRWAQKALFAIAHSGVDASGLDLKGGMVEMAKLAFSALGGIDPDTGGELLDELLTCVQIIPSGGEPRNMIIDSDIEDLRTLFVLRKEVFALHVDFLTQGSSPDSSN